MLKHSERVNQAVVPEWKFCDYNEPMLDEYLEKI